MTTTEYLIAALEPLTSRARTDVSAVKGDNGMAWTREALTRSRIKRHLEGGPARGVCPIKEGESTTRIALFDLDSHKGATSWEGMVEYAANISYAAERQGMRLTPFRSSGGRGIHLFAVWDEPQDAYSVRQHLKLLLLNMGLRDGAKGLVENEVEVFPKQDSVPVGGFGNQFILPLAGKSAPLEPLADYEVMPREYAVRLQWKPSAPVAVVQRPERAVVTTDTIPADLAQLAAALDAIPNDTDPLGYDDWRNVVSGIHHATNGSDEGYALALAFSARAPHFDENELREKVWDWLSDKGYAANPVTERSVFALARQHGWTDVSADDFEPLDLENTQTQAPLPRPAFQRDGNGKIEPVVRNLRAALDRPDVCRMDIRFDEFQGAVVYAPDDEPGAWRPFGDHLYFELRLQLETIGFKPIGREAIRDAVHYRARTHSIDTAMFWLDSLKWDGKPRVETFYPRYFNVEDTPYSRAVSRYAWTALAGRVMEPGVKVDMVPILVGEQGLMKSSGIEAMAPLDTFRIMSFSQPEAERSRLMRGCLVVELAELSGLKTRENEEIKAWITRRKEDWTPKYQEYAVGLLRRCFFQGTSNPSDILNDPTGARRWLPMQSGAVDAAAIARDRDQLWAEAAVLFARNGVEWQEAHRLAPAEHDAYRDEDAWEEALDAWAKRPGLGDEVPAEVGFTTYEAMVSGLNMRDADIRKPEQNRAAKALRALGYEVSVQKTADRKSIRRWRRKT